MKLIVVLAISFMILLTGEDWWLEFVSTMLQKGEKIKGLTAVYAINPLFWLTGRSWGLKFVSAM